jgi:hypothetical protein
MSNFCVAQVEHLYVFIKCEIPFILTGAASAFAIRKKAMAGQARVFGPR